MSGGAALHHLRHYAVKVATYLMLWGSVATAGHVMFDRPSSRPWGLLFFMGFMVVAAVLALAILEVLARFVTRFAPGLLGDLDLWAARADAVLMCATAATLAGIAYRHMVQRPIKEMRRMSSVERFRCFKLAALVLFVLGPALPMYAAVRPFLRWLEA